MLLIKNCPVFGVHYSLVTFQIEPDAAEEVRQVPDSVAPSLEYLDLVIQAFDPTAREARDKVIGDFILPRIERREEFVEARQAAPFDFLDPSANGTLAGFFGLLRLKDTGELLAQFVRPAQQRGTFKKQFELPELFLRESFAVATPNPEHALEGGIFFRLERPFDFTHLAFAQRVSGPAKEF